MTALPNIPLTRELLQAMRHAYWTQKGNARRRRDRTGRQIQFLISFADWAEMWYYSGHWDQRGCRQGQYCMTRIDDLGDYRLGNVEIRLHAENSSEANNRHRRQSHHLGHSFNQGIRRSAETRARMSLQRRGQQYIKNRPIHTPYGVFRTIQEAADARGCRPSNIHYLKRRYPQEYYYIE